MARAPPCRSGGRVAAFELPNVSALIYLLFSFVALGLLGRRLGKGAYILLVGVVAAYVVYAYR